VGFRDSRVFMVSLLCIKLINVASKDEKFLYVRNITYSTVYIGGVPCSEQGP
jgi:hypothetical protein